MKKQTAFVIAKIILILFVCLMVYKLYTPVMYSFGFTDEGDNISIGQYLLLNKKLYTEVFSQHQPLTYYLSAGIQYVVQPDNILLVVRRHRQFVLLFSFAWIAFLTLRYGLSLLPIFTLLEVVKYYLLGHLFLAESIVIYPFIYLTLLFVQVFQKKKTYAFELILFSLSAFFVVFNLLPLAAPIVLFAVLLLWKYRNEYQKLFALLIPGIMVSALLFLHVPLDGYLEGTVWANLFYYIPNSTKVDFNV